MLCAPCFRGSVQLDGHQLHPVVVDQSLPYLQNATGPPTLGGRSKVDRKCVFKTLSCTEFSVLFGTYQHFGQKLNRYTERPTTRRNGREYSSV